MDFKNFFSGLKRQMIGYQDGMSPASRMRNQPLGMEFTEHGGMSPDGLTSILFGGARESIDQNEMAARKQNKMQGIANGVGSIGAAFADAFAGQGQKKSNLAEMFGGFRAKGGPVRKKTAYVVGEEGPEVFVPQEDGEIVTTTNTTVGRDTLTPYREEEVPEFEETIVEKPMSRRQQLEQTLGKTTAELDRRNNKDWKGKDRDDDHNWKDSLRAGGLGFLNAIGSADIGNARGADALGLLLGRGIGGAGTGAVMGAFDRNADEKLGNEMQKSRLAQQYGQQAKMLDNELNAEMKKAQITNAELKPELDKARLKQKERELEAKQNLAQLNYERLVKQEEGRNARANNQTEIKEVDGYLFRAYKNDPTKGLEPIIDPRTGKQAFNPANVAQEITFEDGTKAWAKGGQIVSGMFAGQRQKSQQEFTAEQNNLDRDFRKELQGAVQQFGREQALKQFEEAYKKTFLQINKRAPTQDEITAYMNNQILPGLQGDVGFIPNP